jgi:recombinational DNA repair protein RecR
LRVELHQIEDLPGHGDLDGQADRCGRVALVIISFDIARRVAGACVPVGGELDYLDEGTLAAAIKARKTL